MGETWLTRWNVVGLVALALSAFEIFRRHRGRRRRAEARDRAAVYLDRIATMLDEMASDVMSNRSSPARCAELLQAMHHTPEVLLRAGASSGIKDSLVEALTNVGDAPAAADYTMEEEVTMRAVWAVEDFLRGRNTRSVHAASASSEVADAVRTIRKASGLFKGAAEAMKAL